MTRPPPGVSFAQFFPNAPKIKVEAQGRADRERSKRITQTADSSIETAIAPDIEIHCLPRSVICGVSSDVPLHHTDDNESSPGDMSSAMGSASSHTSSASSVFSSSAQPSATGASSGLSMSVTPITFADSPSYTSISMPAKLEMLTTLAAHHPTKHISHNDTSHGYLSSDAASFSEHITARDPVLSVKGIKCTYDPLLDRLRNKGVSKNAKPIYKEFGPVCVTIQFLPLVWEGGSSSLSSDS